MAEEIKIVITADESGAIQSFNNVEESAESLDKTASGISNSLNKAFSGTKNVEQYGQAVNNTSNTLGKADKATKKATGSLSKFTRGASRGVSALSRFSGVGGKAVRSLSGVGLALAGTPFGAFAVAAAAATAAYSFFSEKLIGDSEAIREENERLTKSLADLNLQLEQGFAQGRLLAIEAQDISETEKNIQKVNVLLEEQGKLIGLQVDNFNALTEAENKLLAAATKSANERLAAEEAVAQAKLDANKNAIEQANIEAKIAQLRKANDDAAKKAAEDRRKAEIETQKLFDSLIRDELEKREAALQSQAEARDRRAKEIIKNTTQLNAFLLQSQKVLNEDLEKLRTEFNDAELKARQALLAQLVNDEEQIAINAATAAAQARAKEIETIAQDDAEKAQLLKDNETKLQTDLAAITAQFAQKRKEEQITKDQELLSLKQAAFEADVQRQLAELDTIEEIERQTFAEVARTEEEITAFKKKQGEEREKAELQFQIKRLELVKEFNKQISAEERAALDSQIQALQTRLQGVGSEIRTAAQDGAQQGDGLFGLLGISSDTQQNIQAVQGALEQVTAEVSKAVAQRIALLQEEIDFRSERIGELQKDLSNEIALNEAGKASNIANVQDQLDQEKAARAKAEREKKEAAKAQFVIDTALQASNLITAISGLYSSLSGLPFGIGVALATALSGVLIGTFIASKTQAANAAGFYEGTENVGKALGKSNATFSGKDGYLGFVGDKQFRFDGDERILNPSQNAALGNMSNEDLVNNALLGAAIPSSSSLAIKNTNLQRNINRNSRENKRQALANSSKAIKEAINGQNSILREQLKAIQDIPEVAQIGDNKTRIKKGNKTEVIKW